MRNPLSLISLRRELGAAAAVSLLALGSAHAQVKTSVQNPGGKDYSKGFQAFYTLGLPDAAKAEYVNVSAYRNTPGMDMDMGSLYELRLQGNGWMLEETPKVKGRFIVGNCQVMEIYDQEALMKEQQKKWEEIQKTNKTADVSAMMEFGGEGDGKTPGQWKKADARKDLDKILGYLKKKDEKADRHDRLSYGNAYGSLFLSAIHFHRRGFTNEANEVVGMLFQSAGDPRKVILQGMDILASSRYGEAYDAFVKKGNWQALDKDLDTLLAKFSTSWKTAPAAKRLAERVKQRLAQAQTPPLAGAGLTDEDKALAMELATTNLSARSYYGGSGQLWILPLPTPSYRGPGVKSDDKDVMTRIKKRGIKSVPLLLALLKDDYLTRIDAQSIRGYGGHSYYYSNDSDEMSEERVTQMYDSMRRPASRSDIAFALLESLPPKKEEARQRREGPMTRDELAEECQAWYEANKAKTPLELARMYFQEGRREQQRAGMQYLVKKGADADLEAIEKHLLDSPRTAMDSSAVQEYVQARGEKAKAFLEKYEAKLGEQSSSGGDEEMFNDKNVQKMVKQQVKYLKTMTTFKPPKELLAEAAAGTKTVQEISQGLYQGLAKEKPEAALTLILDAALQAKDAGTCRDLVSMAPATRYMRGMAMGGEIAQDDTEEAEPAKPEPLQIAKHAEQWKKLLSDKRPLDTIGVSAATVGDAVAMTIDGLYAQDESAMMSYRARSKTVTSLGRRTQAIYRARAEALLAGKKGDELPPFPSIGDIKDEQKKAAVDKMMKAPDASLEQTVSGLSLPELAALTLAAPKDKKLNAKLASVANKVRNVSGDADLAADLKDLEAAKGKAMNKYAAEKLLAVCRKLTAAGKVVRCSAIRASGLDGIEITVRQVKPESKEYKALIDSGALGGTDPKADVSGTVADSACHGSSVWPLEAAGAADTGKKAAAVTEDDKLLDAAIADAEAQIKNDMIRDQGDFWKVVDEFCAGKGNVCGSGMIFFVGTPAIKTQPKAEPPKPAAKAEAAVAPAPAAKPAAPAK